MSVERINSDENSKFTHILCTRTTIIQERHTAHATKVPGLIFLSGQTPVDKNGKLVDGGIKEHTTQCIKNLENVLRAAGSDWEKVVKVNVYLKDMDNFGLMNEVYEKLLPNPKPARTCIQAGKLPNDVDIEIEAIAAY
ncbi:Endoribonuclease L-PSP [Lentinula raphanica]|nr:Endoribonuclease L-PSP [Lentinula raphanica]